ncbi:unnamed protein product [Spirodela intermedia]|uniref:Uncharacterized protein n=1 Tax=Spirodela intermedia TaxID=51605 RepID=A0A7I8K866_SPIIN|nr:unnamed protein product [Spirodela intermedia]
MEIPIPKREGSSFPEAHQEGNRVEKSGNSPVTSCLYLRASHGGNEDDQRRKRLDKNLVLRRIRDHRRANENQDPVQKASLRVAGGERCFRRWMDEDAFSSP